MANNSLYWDYPDYYRIYNEGNNYNYTNNSQLIYEHLQANYNSDTIDTSFNINDNINNNNLDNIDITSNINNNKNNSAKLSYEGGSNFMLLLEDFGEYFYNYNGSGFNETTYIGYQTNCSLVNSTCSNIIEGN